jgi:hypothetical protein
MDGTQGRDPTKLAGALVRLTALEDPSLRFAAGSDTVAALKAKAAEVLAQADGRLELSSQLADDDE